MSHPRPLTRQPLSHHLHQRTPLLDHFFILYLLSILVDIITYVDILYFGIECMTWKYLIVLSQSNIYISFFLYLNKFFLYPLLITLLFFESCGFSYTTQTLCHSGSTTSSLYFNRSWHIKDTVDLSWGESKGRKLLIMLSYLVNLVLFA